MTIVPYSHQFHEQPRVCRGGLPSAGMPEADTGAPARGAMYSSRTTQGIVLDDLTMQNSKHVQGKGLLTQLREIMNKAQEGRD